jgi:multidrug resistance efflux pump
MDAALPPIPTPAAHGWRRVRQHFLPGIVFVAGVAATVVVWSRWVAPAALLGEVETIRAEVRPVQAGVLADVAVRMLQPVRAGDVLARVAIAEPQVLDASLAVIRAEIEVMRQTTEQRTLLDYERLMLDLMSERVKLAALKSQLHQAESTFVRVKNLHAGRLVTDEQFEESQNARDALLQQVKAQTELVSRITPEATAAAPAAAGLALPSPARTLRASLQLQEEKLRLTEAQLKPVALVAPIDGVVTLVHRRAGETVAPGEPVFQITALTVETIVGFMRQPVGEGPKPGDTVEVRTRALPRRLATATVAQVGVQLEPLPPTLLAALNLPVSAVPTELGLRVHVAAPAGLALRPGEQVELVVLRE